MHLIPALHGLGVRLANADIRKIHVLTLNYLAPMTFGAENPRYKQSQTISQ